MINHYSKKTTLNYRLLLPILLLLILSTWLQYWVAYHDEMVNSVHQLIKQLIFIGVGIICMFGIMLLNKKVVWKMVPYFYIFSLLLMLALYFFYDTTMYQITGTRRWLSIAGFQFQPSEIAKIAYILFLSKILIEYNMTLSENTWQNDLKELGKLCLYSIPLFLLMFMQKDFGTSLVFLCIFAALIIASGINWRIIAVLSIFTLILGFILIVLVFTEYGQHILTALHFKPYQLNRVRAWANPFEFADSIAYQQVQGLKAIGSGGLIGHGVHGISVYVPVQESDMIFTFVGEAYGFIGCTLTLILFMYLFFQIFYAGIKSNSTFNIYIGIGIVFMLLFQIVENIGASIGLLPLTGIPLPFLSQGGTSLIATLMALGFMLEISINDTIS
ncbi:FtsW/RodA/SpoVE family cell cycle protein [Vagococcus vulneris]|uniref:Cell division protein FtsW n=1 Tax=Vagococcus vulneris TaxID=1977869 RepID=A0A429ZY06_9ENTE|nr:FtsW/RodA/SpoVE family cell cycle protein [Vagococcus vulneris]RST98789.1 cell division protein FtsW [Vagococcus vulneris]